MTVFRRAPKCATCGEEAEAVYEDQSHLPMYMRTIGDTFLHWKPIECKCKDKQGLGLGDRNLIK